MTNNKLEILSAISRDIAQVFFASVFIGPIVSGQTNVFLVASGLLLSMLTWLLSLGFIKD